MKVKNVITKQGTDITDLINNVAGDAALAFTGLIIAESNLDEKATRVRSWPDVSGGLTQVIAQNLGYKNGDDLTQYWNYMYDPSNALNEGWKYFKVAVQNMQHPVLAMLMYNMGPNNDTNWLHQQALTPGTTAYQRYQHYAESFQQAILNYAETDFAPETQLSPNRGAGPIVPVGICCHITGGPFDSALNWLTTAASQVSAHFIISKAGRIVQLVPMIDRAWAQGITTAGSEWTPIVPTTANPNGYLISIEHEGVPGDPDFMNPTQYNASLKVQRFIKDVYWIIADRDHIVGHYQFDKINRSNCPSAAFPFDQLIQDLNTEDTSIMEEIQRLQGELDQSLGREKDLGEQLAYCQQLKSEVEDKLSKDNAALQARIAELEASQPDNTSSAILIELQQVLNKVMSWKSQTPSS